LLYKLCGGVLVFIDDKMVVVIKLLDYNKIYFWQITATDGNSSSGGPVWQFNTRGEVKVNTPPLVPLNPKPADLEVREGSPIKVTANGNHEAAKPR